ncbi:hypothetical protein [Phyllobacterium sp. 628]|uniref:hypothetical protein n=1 Tax=Phyllobacterium sp. 628 TaxID=2718938 RepID=UPI001FCE9A3D|nr:hypothetical protein [Phyllobacterium sp. 628]
MFKAIMVASVLSLAFIPSAFAEDAMKCDEATMMKMKTDMDMMKEPAMKDKKTWP